MFKAFQRTFRALFLTQGEVSDLRHRNYRSVLWVIIGLHVLGFIAAAALTKYYRGHEQGFAYFSSMLQILGVLSGLFLFIIALKSEVIVSQTHDFAISTAQATTHNFSSIHANVQWLNEHLGKDKFPNVPLRLFTSVSTPLYGIGETEMDAAKEFIKYVRGWVEHFKAQPAGSADPPVWEFAIWSPDIHKLTFQKPNYLWDDRDKNKVPLIEEFASILQQIHTLRIERRIDFRFYFTDKSDARVFMVKSDKVHFGGLIVMYSPLTPDSVHNKKWALTGFSFNQEEAFRHMSYFNQRLQHTIHDGSEPVNHVGLLKDAKAWIRVHYGIDAATPSQKAPTNGLPEDVQR
jgi:hypothetical protein